MFYKSETVIFDSFNLLMYNIFEDSIEFYMLVSIYYDDPDFSKIRRNSQDNLKNINKVFDIYDVYKEMSKYINLKPNESALKEMDLLERFIYINNEVRYIINETIPDSVKKVIINDTIYPDSWLLKLIKELGITSSNLEILNLNTQKVSASTTVNKKSTIYICRKENREIGTGLFGESCICYDDSSELMYTMPIMNQSNNGMSPLIGSAYNGIIKRKQRLEENNNNNLGYNYGYYYGGMYCIGYASWIFDICKFRNIDKVLFLARDGYSLIEVFKSLYKGFPVEYAMWSRSVAARSCAHLFPFYFISNILYSRRKKNFVTTVYDMLKYLGIEEIEEYKLHKYSLNYNMKIGTQTDNINNFDRFIKFAIDNIDEIISGLSNERQAAKSYFKNLIGEYRNIAIVDTGYSGSNLMVLKHAIENEWVPGCKVLPLMAGIMPRFMQACPPHLMNNDISTYMFSPNNNTNLMYDISKYKFSPLFFELFSASPDPSIVKLDKDKNGSIIFEHGEVEYNNLSVNKWIHEGILDFTKDYEEMFEGLEFMRKIPGSDVGQIAKSALDDSDLLKATFANYHNYINLGMPTLIKNNYSITDHIR